MNTARLIDANAFSEHWHISGKCEECHWNNRDCSKPPYYSLHDICEAIDDAPTIDAIPVEWLKNLRKDERATLDDVESIDWILAWWQEEQEAQDRKRDYEANVEMAEYCERYEPTFNAEDGSM